MKKQIRLTILMLVAGLLAGCNPTISSGDSESPTSTTEPVSTTEPTSDSEPESSSEEEPPLTEQEFNLSVDVIAKTVPLVVEKVTTSTIRTNIYRNAQTPVDPVPELKGGNELTLIDSGTLVYEDEVNEVYLYPEYTITWSYMGDDNPETEYGTFDFVKDKDNKTLATPGYPTYKPEFDGGGNPIHVIPNKKLARLYATIHIGERSKRINIDMFLAPIEFIELYDLITVRELVDNTVAKVRGYVTGIFADWNNAGIADGKTGLGVFKLQDYKGAFEIGDLVEVIGLTKNYNGLSQLQYIKSVKVIDKANFPEIKTPEVNDFTIDELYEASVLEINDPMSPLFDKDNALVRFDRPFKFKTVKDATNADVGLDGFITNNGKHHDVILEAETSDGTTFEVKLSMNYHIGAADLALFKAFLVANQNNAFYYEGQLTAYNEFNLGPYQFAGTLTAAV